MFILFWSSDCVSLLDILSNSAGVVRQRITNVEDLQQRDIWILSQPPPLPTDLTIILNISEVSVCLALAAEWVHIRGGEDGVWAGREAGNLVLQENLL